MADAVAVFVAWLDVAVPDIAVEVVTNVACPTLIGNIQAGSESGM